MRFLSIIVAFLVAVVAHSIDLENLLSKELHLFSTPTLEPTAEPTASPTVFSPPTFAPTASPTKLNLIDFTAGHILHNINAADYNAQASTYNNVFKQILATVMNVNQADIATIEVKASQRAFNARSLTTGAQSYMQYRVTLHSDTKSFASLSALLKASVTPNPSTGVIYMNTLIASMSPSGSPLASATIDNVDIQNNLEGRSASSQLTGTMIAGLVIGIVLFLVLVAVLVAFVLKNKQQPPAADNTYTAASTTELTSQV